MTMIKDRFLVNYKRFDTESGTYYLYNNSIKKLYNKFNITEENEEEMLKAIAVDMLEDWAIELQEQFKASTYNVIIEHLKEYFFYLANKRHTLQFNPMDAISKASLEEVESDAKDKYIPTLDEVRALIESTRIRGNNEKQFEFNSVRDRAILQLLSSQGLRQSIIRVMKIEDIKRNDDIVIIEIDKSRTKTNINHRICFGGKTKKYFNEYLKIRNKFGISSDLIFTSSKGGQLSRSNVISILNKAINKIGLNVPKDVNFSPHNLRHFTASMLVLNNENEILIKRIMNWSINTNDMLNRYSNHDEMYDLEKVRATNFLD